MSNGTPEGRAERNSSEEMDQAVMEGFLGPEEPSVTKAANDNTRFTASQAKSASILLFTWKKGEPEGLFLPLVSAQAQRHEEKSL